ncbi:FAD-binding protein [Uliginosibacterium sp. sgz301328]|uniref:FAD-binding protein n=1 Tax=Uliginosibacterium sp. sgz301328 TaxID=3243764 RepID=UPI00359D8DDF
MPDTQALLDALTDVDMPPPPASPMPHGTVDIGGMRIPRYRSTALVLGSGAAGLRAAVELARRKVDVMVTTQTLYWGTSACSGSDKQTLHTASTHGHGDSFLKMAGALSAGGAMDADTAYVEAVGSIEAMAGLQYIGLPLPQDRFGAVLRYQTDHDEAGRATSCGPRTSRLMVKVLAEEAIRLGVPTVNRATAVRILTRGEGAERRCCGLLAVNADKRAQDNPFGLELYECDSLVLAAGGPGELFRDSVYPVHCFGSLGLALEAGVDTVNLTEHQFGIGTGRDGFPWNLSGTYMQAMPYIYSEDAQGKEYNFLADYYRSTQELASNIFRKGYQWPFHASRMTGFGSSLIDLAVFIETRRGRTVYMDFNRNPAAVPGSEPFSLERLDDDVAAYLRNNDAALAQPIDRLKRMNPLSIELYLRLKHDLRAAPLPFKVNHQHMNGGVAVDIWGHSSLRGCYAIGEAAGTHGVTRPGGAALNAGQVFGIRCAAHIHAQARPQAESDLPMAQIETEIDWLARNLGNADGLAIADIRTEVQARMSDKAGFICQTREVPDACARAEALNRAIAECGIRFDQAPQAANAVLWRQMAVASEAILHALRHYIVHGGGSRGARALCAPNAPHAPETRQGPLDAFRFIAERPQDRAVQIHVRRVGSRFDTSERPPRTADGTTGVYFEKNWMPFLKGDIYRT